MKSSQWWPTTKNKEKNIYVDFLSLAYGLLVNIRRSGLRSIESVVEYMDISETAKSYPEIGNYPHHLEFMLDIFRLMVAECLNEGDLSKYAQNAKNAYVEGIPDIDAKLFDCIWQCISACLCGYSPYIAVEFARQFIPFDMRPNYLSLEARVRDRKYPGNIEPVPLRNFDEAIEELVSSFDR